MNKLSKGLIVSGLGVALLLGTGGSLALWNVTTSSNAGSIVTGDLNLAVIDSGKVWEIKDTAGDWQQISDISTFTMVPGDVVRLTQPLDVTLTGTNMKADLTVDTSNAIKTAEGDIDPGTYLTVTTGWGTAPSGEALPTQVDDTNVWQFGGPLSAGKATFTQQVTFSFSATTPDRIGANTTIDLASTTFKLEQNYLNAPAA